MSSPDVTFPEPTPEERELQAEQLSILRESRTLQQEQLRVQNLLLPLFFEASGFEPTFEEGRLTDITRAEPTELDTLRSQIEKGFLERSAAALSGDLPINPALERELQEGEETLRERLRKQLGPGFETSTPGIEALAQLRQRSTELREGARRGDLTLAEQLSLARSGEQQATTQDFLNRLLGGANFFSSSLGTLGGISSQINPILNRGFAERQGQFQANLENQSTLFGDLLGLGGTLGGAFLGGGTSFSKLFS